jgi:glycosyltransferase involved in cell wall biosynthesis
MRIAFLTHEPFHPPSGGGSAEAIYLVEEMVRRGHEVHLFCPRFTEPDRVKARFGVELHLFTTWQMGRYTSLRNLKYLAYPFLLQRLVERVARATRFEVVLSQHAISALAAGRLRRSLGLPVAMNFLDFLTGFMETWPGYLAPRPLLRRLERFELSMPVRYGAEGVLTVSDTLADHFVRAGYPRRQIRPIYYGYDSALFAPKDAERAGESEPVVVMHGSFDHHHLGPVALGAMRTVARARPEVRFRFVGQETPALVKFRERARAEVPALQLECTGFVPYDQVAARLQRAAVGIVPYEESSGVHCAFVAKIVEYLATGLPVVSTSLDSAQRYFGREPAVKFAGFDGDVFGQAVLDWLKEPAERRDRVGRAASQRVRAELDWRVIGKNAIDFVEQIAQEQRGIRE